jgi:hypothetical protein
MVTKIDKSKHETIGARVKRGDRLQTIGDDYGVSRERIRQIAKEQGAVPNEITIEKRNLLIADVALEIIEEREQWIPSKFSERGFTRKQFESFLEGHNPKMLERWKFADTLPISSTGVADPNGRVCTTCRVRKPWGEYYHSKVGINGKAIRCAQCTRDMVDHYYQMRHVPEPTVEAKVCSHCKLTKDASEFSRSTNANSGLQSWCKDCQRDAG